MEFVSEIETDRNFTEFKFLASIVVINRRDDFRLSSGEMGKLGEIVSVSIDNARRGRSGTFKISQDDRLDVPNVNSWVTVCSVLLLCGMSQAGGGGGGGRSGGCMAFSIPSVTLSVSVPFAVHLSPLSPFQLDVAHTIVPAIN